MNKAYIDFSNMGKDSYDMLLNGEVVKRDIAPGSGFSIMVESGEYIIRFNYAGSVICVVEDTKILFGRMHMYVKKGFMGDSIKINNNLFN